MSQPLLLLEWSDADVGAISALQERGELPHLSRLQAAGVRAGLKPVHPATPPPHMEYRYDRLPRRPARRSRRLCRE